MHGSGFGSAHLVRCQNHGCGRFILSTDVRCPHCGVERASFQLFRISVTLSRQVLVPCALILVLFLCWYAMERQVEKHREEIEQRQAG